MSNPSGRSKRRVWFQSLATLYRMTPLVGGRMLWLQVGRHGLRQATYPSFTSGLATDFHSSHT